MVAEVYGFKFLTTKSIDSSKQLKKADSQLLQKAAVPEPTVMHGSADLSSTLGLSPSASSCDTQSEHKINDTDDGLSMMASNIHSDGTVATVKGQRSSIFKSECTVKDKGVNHVFKPIPESAIKAEVFATLKMKKKVAEITPKPRTALLQEGENTLNTSAKGTANKFSEIIIKLMVALALEGENDIVSEATCNGSEIAKAALNTSSM
ncbi:uncharacterized protein [Miscanthus floridulus]|uniref:uncharacterized protein n=1 Tax=Miscanthus floridulus TaxID=154761 RepID=UPI0034595B99